MALYGLKKAPRLWFSKLSATLLKMGFIQSKVDYSLFILQSESTITFLLVYMDDLLICGNSLSTINSIKQLLSQSFQMKDLGPISYFLGIEIHKYADGFFLSQKKYTTYIFQEFGMLHAKPVKLHMDIKLQLTPEA